MNRTAELAETAELPDLEPAIQLLETDVRGALPALVVDQVLGDGAAVRSERSTAARRALWADANGHARTRAIADVAPNRRVLRRISVARGFTAYQHYAIVEALAERALEDGSSDPALLVAPAIDAPYRDDGLRGDEGESMLVRALARLAGVARRLEIPVLVTRTRDDELTAPVENAADETIHCERTPMGPRFASEDFETLVYPAGDGLVQTTLAFWQRVLERRAPDRIADDAGAATVGGDGGTRTAGDDVATTPASEPAGTGQPVAAQPSAVERPAIVRGEPVANADRVASVPGDGASVPADGARNGERR